MQKRLTCAENRSHGRSLFSQNEVYQCARCMILSVSCIKNHLSLYEYEASASMMTHGRLCSLYYELLLHSWLAKSDMSQICR
ncbi:uncharacterized protein [Coffea arabica]|uniref:Uncharacterized protein isoform X1 n=1 Tax=Coffea arabica TaxID=13443 RepID=A0ABM4UVW5_COFAR